MNNIAYPHFRPLSIEDQPLIETALKNNPPEISEFTFTNLFAWRDIYHFQISLLDNFILLTTASDQMRKFFPPIGKSDCKKIIERVLQETGGTFIRIPENIKNLFEADVRFTFEEDRDNFDYIYEADELIKLRGAKYDGKRNFIKRFKSSYEYEYVSLDRLNAKECLEFEEAWCSIKHCDQDEGLRHERKAFEEIIAHFSSFDLVGGMMKVDGTVRAVAIAQGLNPSTFVMHILKADQNFTGLYQTVINEFLSREAGTYAFVNFEQDLGLEGLRKSKLSYRPVRMVKKFTLCFT